MAQTAETSHFKINNKRQDLVGKRFGKLTVLEYLSGNPSPSVNFDF